MSILDQFNLAGKTAVVAGARGRYGRQISEALAEAGARLVLASSNRPELEKMAAGLRQSGYDVRAAELDQGSEASILQLKETVLAECGTVDILVNNAILRPMKNWADDAAAFDASMHFNATGIFLLIRAFGDAMAARGGGSIINIGSIQGMVGTDGSLYEGLPMAGFIPDYFFHKGGMINLTRTAASYYGPHGVRCNCLSPGGYYEDTMSPVFVHRYEERTFLGRMANSTDLKGAVVFLASDASVYVTGTNLAVDGGYTAK